MTLRGALVSLFKPTERAVADAAVADIRQELLAHIEMRAEDNVAAGMEPAQARRDAESRFGDIDQIERACRAHGIGGGIVLQRINLAMTVILGITLAWMFVQNHHLRNLAMQERDRAMSVQADLLNARMDRTLVESIEIAVGDRIEVHSMHGHWEPFTARVARDGKLLLQRVGWVHVAGLTRQEAERRASELCAKFYSTADVKLVVQDDE